MKKMTVIIVFICALLFGSLHSIAQTATWTGAVDSNWNNAANWSWSSGGTGLPTSSTDIFIDPMTSMHDIFISGGNEGYCNNIYFELSDMGISYGGISIIDSASLNIYGNIEILGTATSPSVYIYNTNYSDATDYINEKATLNFKGAHDQNIPINTVINIGKMNINKTGGDVYVGSESLVFINDSLNFHNAPVVLGTAPNGNMILEEGSIMIVKKDLSINTDVSDPNKVPPHIIPLLNITGSDYFPIIIADIEILEGTPSGVSGTFDLPLGHSTLSYNPVSISTSDNLLWGVMLSDTNLVMGCSYDKAYSVKSFYQVYPLSYDSVIDEVSILTTTPSNTTLKFGFHTGSNSNDVGADFSDTATILPYSFDAVSCFDTTAYTSLINTQDGLFHTTQFVTKEGFPLFLLKHDAPSGIHDMEFAKNIIITPNPATDKIMIQTQEKLNNISIYDVLGKEVFKQNLSSSNNNHTIDVSNLTTNIYILVITSEDGKTMTKKIVKQ